MRSGAHPCLTTPTISVVPAVCPPGRASGERRERGTQPRFTRIRWPASPSTWKVGIRYGTYLQMRKNFLGSKIAFYLSLGLHKGRPSYLALQNLNFLHFWGTFWPSLIRIRIRIPNADPDPADQNEYGSVRIRIHNTAYLSTPIRLMIKVKHNLRQCCGAGE